MIAFLCLYVLMVFFFGILIGKTIRACVHE